MTPTKNYKTLASNLILLSIILGITLTSAIAEDNYKNDNNFLTNISETTHTENGYKTNIIINPNVVGIYANENGYKLDLTINTQGIGGSLKENNYQLDLIPQKTFPHIPDLAVTNLTPSKTVVGQGYTITIETTIKNKGFYFETFNFIAQANTTTIQTKTITLTSGNSTTITFTWNTAGVAKGNYIITAKATPVPDETDTTDNTRTDGLVTVTGIGDVNGDFTVNVLDVILIFINAGPVPPKPPECDVNCDGAVNVLDVILCFINAGPCK